MSQQLEGDGRLQRATGLTAISAGHQSGSESPRVGTLILPDGSVRPKPETIVLPRKSATSSVEPVIRRSAGTMPQAIMLDGSQTRRRSPAISDETAAVKTEQLTANDLLGKSPTEIDSLFFTPACLNLRRAFFAAYPTGNGAVPEFITYLNELAAPQAAAPTLPMETDQKIKQDNASAQGAHVYPIPQVEELRRELAPPASPREFISQKAAEARGGLSADFGQPDRMSDGATRSGILGTIRNILPIPRRNVRSNSVS